MTYHSWSTDHSKRTIRSLAKALFATAIVFLMLFSCFRIAGGLYVSTLSTRARDAFHTGITQDLAHLKTQGDSLAGDDRITQYIHTQDSEKLIELLREERRTRGVGLMGVVDAEGVIVGRTKTLGKRGDNVFLTDPVGRVVSKGLSAESIETPFGFDPIQLLLTTGRPIIKEGKMVGGLFANYLTDDEYAQRFHSTYLPKGVEVVFYTKQAGVYGTSFTSADDKKIIRPYFNSGSEWIQNSVSGKTVSFEDGRLYLVENIVFPGLENTYPGGALLFIPRVDLSNVMNGVTTLSIFIIFGIIALRYHYRTRGEERGWRYYVLFIIASIPIVTLSLVTFGIHKTGFTPLERIPYLLYNSTIHLQPEAGVFDIGFEQRFSIIVDTGDEAVNAVDIGLIFDPSLVDVKLLDTASSSCAYVIENKIDTVNGKANMSCVVFTPGGERGTLYIADVVASPRTNGTFTLSFDLNETQVLASDGLGTNVLRMAQSGSYHADFFSPYIGSTTARSFVVFSPTHANRSRWYNSDTARFVWKGTPGAVYKYEFNTMPDTIPSKKYTTQDSEITLPIPGDGIFYFHLQDASGGPVAHYRIQSDVTPPTISSLRLSADKVFVGDVVRFSFEAKDIGSGIQRNYYVDLGNKLFLPIGSNLFVPFLEKGNQTVTLRVYDGANNYSEKSQIIYVEEK